MINLLRDLAQIYQLRASESLQVEDLAHAKRYREAADLLEQQAGEIERLKADNEQLFVALDQLLDDMGDDGHCVCDAAKQLATKAIAAHKARQGKEET